MSKRKFLAEADVMTVEMAGNTLTGEPRTFSSGACGWYLSGKVEIPVGDKVIWSQVGLNAVIPGSNDWKA